MSSWTPTKYKTKNWSSCNHSLKQRGSVSIWFDPEMVWTPPPSGKRGRQQQFSDAAMRIWISATCRSKSCAINDWPRSLIQCILVLTRLRRWYPLRRRHRVRPRYRCVWTASLRAIAPVLVGFQDFAFLRGGTTAWASLAAIASWHLRVSYAHPQ